MELGIIEPCTRSLSSLEDSAMEHSFTDCPKIAKIAGWRRVQSSQSSCNLRGRRR